MMPYADLIYTSIIKTIASSHFKIRDSSISIDLQFSNRLRYSFRSCCVCHVNKINKIKLCLKRISTTEKITSNFNQLNPDLPIISFLGISRMAIAPVLM